MISINIGSLNVRGLRDKTKRNEMFTWLKNKNLSIIFLQETHCTNELEDVWRTGWGIRYFSVTNQVIVMASAYSLINHFNMMSSVVIPTR